MSYFRLKKNFGVAKIGHAPFSKKF